MSPRSCRSRLALAAGLATLAGASRQASAGGFEVAQQDAAAAGMGSAATGLPGSAAAGWFNPAALADGAGLRTELGISLAFTTIHAQALDDAPDAPWEADTANPVGTPAYLYASFAHADWAAGVAVQTAFGSSVAWPDDWIQRFDIQRSQLQFLRIAPYFAYRIDILRLAAGPQIDVGRLYVKRATNHVAEEGSAAMVLSGVGVGGQASVFVEAGSGVSLGVSYKSRSLVPLEGDADFNLPSTFAPDYPDQHVSSELTLPDRLAFGIGAEVGPVRLAFDATLTLWGVNQELAFDFEHDATPDRTQINDWRHTFALRGGAEYTPLEELSVRLGLYGDGIAGAPPPDETLAPSSPDASRVAITLGASAHPTSFLWIDAFYEHLWLLERSSTSADAPLASYRGSGNLVGFALRTAWDPFAEPEPDDDEDAGPEAGPPADPEAERPPGPEAPSAG